MTEKKYLLEERLTVYSENLINLCRKAPKDIVTTPIVNQLIRSGTSIGANYCEANGASSKKDFKNKIHLCKKEAIETKYWLRLLGKSAPKLLNDSRKMWKETQEFTLIFSKIIGSMRSNKN